MVADLRSVLRRPKNVSATGNALNSRSKRVLAHDVESGINH